MNNDSLRSSIIRTRLFFKLITCIVILELNAQDNVNYDEASVPNYELPGFFSLGSENNDKTIDNWEQRIKPNIIELFEKHVYGKVPDYQMTAKSMILIEESLFAIDGNAIRRQYELVMHSHLDSLTIQILLYLPKTNHPPIFLGYNFYGNHSITPDSNVILTASWLRNKEDYGITDNVATEESRGTRSHRWDIKQIIDAGFGLATVYCGDIDPDRNQFNDGIHALFEGKEYRGPSNGEWGTIAAWAWGLSEILTMLKGDEFYPKSKFIVFGHSRLGKTSLWAGAKDKRFDLVISNNSGCGGASLFRREFGERIEHINGSFPHWFTPNFKNYNNLEQSLPIDQHMLLACVAPRPVYISSATEDLWADPKGEYLSALSAGEIYELYNKIGLRTKQMPQPNEPIHNDVGYHIRTGQHDVTAYDWQQFIAFAEQHFKDK